MANKFRNPVNNSRYTRQLFYECYEGADNRELVLYSLKDVDHEGYPSLYRLYMAMDDPTEYEFAMKYFDGWEHWQMITKASWFKPYVVRWREELRLREAAKRIRAIREEADEGSRNSLQALKYLLERGWEPKETKKTRKEVDEEAEEVKETISVKDHAKRLGISLVK